jgi:predicted DNA-binding protein
MKTTATKDQKTTLRFDRELHKRLRVLAIETGKTFTECVQEAAERYLETEEPKVRRSR